MPLIHHARKELHLKIVYYGAGLGGKTTNLEYLHRHSNPNARGKLVSLKTESERTLFFDLLPVDLGEYRSYRVRLHLCTVPGQIALDKTRRLVLRHVDGVVFVVDSQPGRMDTNLESMENLHRNLRLQGDDPASLPLVVQCNKRDLPDALPVGTIRDALRIPVQAPVMEASALHGAGVFGTLKMIVKICLGLIRDPAQTPEGRTPSVLPPSAVSAADRLAAANQSQLHSGARHL